MIYDKSVYKFRPKSRTSQFSQPEPRLWLVVATVALMLHIPKGDEEGSHSLSAMMTMTCDICILLLLLLLLHTVTSNVCFCCFVFVIIIIVTIIIAFFSAERGRERI